MARAPAAPKTPGTTVAKANTKTNLPVSIEDEMAAEVAALSSRLQAPSGDRIGLTKTGVFKLPNGEENDALNVVIVDFVATNAFYDKPYVPGEFSPPACFAIGAANNNDLEPSPNSPVPQSDSCGTCWANEFKSAANGKGKACSNNRLLAVTAPDEEEDRPILLLKVPTTSMKGFDGYVDSVARAFKMPVRAVMTEVTSTPGDWENCQFGHPEPLSRDLLLRVHARKQEAMDRLMVEPDCSTYTAPVAKGKPAGRAPAGRAPAAKRG